MRISSLVLATCLFVVGSSTTKLGATEPEVTGLSVSISFTPSSSNPNVYSCRAKITDLASGNTLGIPSMLGMKGESARAQIVNGDSSLVLNVTVNQAGTNGTYTVTYTKSGKVIAIQQGSISIR